MDMGQSVLCVRQREERGERGTPGKMPKGRGIVIRTGGDKNRGRGIKIGGD